ncbi:MAG: uroporphyrinogen decarboxylase family protein [Armatimonadota bacterium]|nr:uroporphyrinogen decarboxylase family protein [Armatimonadota bacterium]
MSYEIGRAALNLQWTERVARTEYNDNWEIVRHITGKDPRVDPTATKEFNDAVRLDYLWTVNDGPVPWAERGRVCDMGHAVYVEDGSDYRKAGANPFETTEEVLSFNAVQEYGIPDFGEVGDYYERWYQETQAANDQVISGGYYKTLVSGAIEAFGWEMLLRALGEDADRFGEQALGSIFELSMRHYEAWAATSIEFFMCHDDMVWTEGPFANPTFYRNHIFPRYAELWKPLRAAGKRIIFCSDGTFDMFLDDLARAGADGFCFEPTNDLEMMVRDYGKTHVLMGGADCRTLTFGSKEDIERELRWVFGLARDCPGFVFATGNHLPANIPLENALFYFELAEELGRR